MSFDGRRINFDCPVGALACALFVSYDPRTAWMAFLTGYFDASGDNADTDAVTVGGYMAPVRSWSRFHRDWRKILDPLNIDVFHLTDFIAGRKEFYDWKDQPAKQMALLRRLAKTIRAHAHFSVTQRYG